MEKIVKMFKLKDDKREVLARFGSVNFNLQKYAVLRIAPGLKSQKCCYLVNSGDEKMKQIAVNYFGIGPTCEIDWSYGCKINAIVLRQSTVIFCLENDDCKFEVNWEMHATYGCQKGQDVVVMQLGFTTKQRALAEPSEDFLDGGWGETPEEMMTGALREVEAVRKFFLRVELTKEGYVAKLYADEHGMSVDLATVREAIKRDYQHVSLMGVKADSIPVWEQTETLKLDPSQILDVRLQRAIQTEEGCPPFCVERVNFFEWMTVNEQKYPRFAKSWRKGLPVEDGWRLVAVKASTREVRLEFVNGLEKAVATGRVSGECEYWPYDELWELVLLVRSHKKLERVTLTMNDGEGYGDTLGYSLTAEPAAWMSVKTPWELRF